MRTLPALLFAALLGGCSYADMDKGNFPNDTGYVDIPAGTLRLDVLPPTSAGDGTLLPQSTIVPPDAYVGLGIDLLPTRTVVGTLTAEVARGWAMGPPTSTEPLVATLRALPGDGRLSGVAQSAEDGTFTLKYPAYQPSRFPIAILPTDASMAPIRVVAAPTADAFGWNQVLEPGIPVYGRVTGLVGGEARGIEGVQMRISRMAGDDALTSGTFTTDASGWYVARVDEIGEYDVEVVGGPTFDDQADGDDGLVAPNRIETLVVESEEGAQLDMDIGPVEALTADGTVTDSAGRPIPQPRIELVSTRLDGHRGSLTVETVGTVDGNFITRDLLPGIYDIRIMPPVHTEATLSPLIERRRIDADTRLGSFQLPPATRLSGTLLDVDGRPAKQALILATELEYPKGDIFYTYTDGDGRFDFAVPNIPLVVALVPSDPNDGAIAYVPLAPEAGLSLQLEQGVLVDGVLSYDGEPVPYASVEVYEAVYGLLLGQAISNEDGYFSLRVSLPESDIDSPDTGDGEDTGREDTGGEDTGAEDTASGGDTAPDSGGDTSGGDTADTADDSAR